jgi:hypothetical protein
MLYGARDGDIYYPPSVSNPFKVSGAVGPKSQR